MSPPSVEVVERLPIDSQILRNHEFPVFEAIDVDGEPAKMIAVHRLRKPVVDIVLLLLRSAVQLSTRDDVAQLPCFHDQPGYVADESVLMLDEIRHGSQPGRTA